MLTAKDRRIYFNKLKQAMSNIAENCQIWRKHSASNTPEYSLLEKLEVDTTRFQTAYIQSDPADDKAMEKIANGMSAYLDLTEIDINQLLSIVGDKEETQKEKEAIQASRAYVSEWISSVLSNTKSSTNAGQQQVNDTAAKSEEVIEVEAEFPLGESSTPEQAAIIRSLQVDRDTLFLTLLTRLQNGETPIVRQTSQLLHHEGPKLTDLQIKNLLTAWDDVIQFFTETFIQELDPIEAIVSFNVIHASVETLYNELTTNVKRTSEDSLDSLLFSRY